MGGAAFIIINNINSDFVLALKKRASFKKMI